MPSMPWKMTPHPQSCVLQWQVPLGPLVCTYSHRSMLRPMWMVEILQGVRLRQHLSIRVHGRAPKHATEEKHMPPTAFFHLANAVCSQSSVAQTRRPQQGTARLPAHNYIQRKLHCIHEHPAGSAPVAQISVSFRPPTERQLCSRCICHASRKLTLSSWHGFVLKWY